MASFSSKEPSVFYPNHVIYKCCTVPPCLLAVSLALLFIPLFLYFLVFFLPSFILSYSCVPFSFLLIFLLFIVPSFHLFYTLFFKRSSFLQSSLLLYLCTFFPFCLFSPVLLLFRERERERGSCIILVIFTT